MFNMDAVFTETLPKLALPQVIRSLCTILRLAVVALIFTIEAVVIDALSNDAFSED